MQKQNISSVGKRGFTLVELSVVIALLAILVTMTVTFTMAMNGFVGVNRAEYDYLEEHSKLKEEISNWIAKNDAQGNVFEVEKGTEGTCDVLNLFINGDNSNCQNAYFKNNRLELNGVESEFDSIASVTFETIFYDKNGDGSQNADEENKLIKCTTESVSGKSQTFVVSMRFAEIGGGT